MLAAKRLNRRYIGINIDAENVAIAKERLGLEQDGKQSHQQLLLSSGML